MDPADWGVISDAAKDLVRRILVVNPDARLSAAEILQHPWMKMDASAIPDVDLSQSVAALKKYQARKRLKKAMNAVRATVRTRMLFAARAAKAAKQAGKPEEEVERAFFEAARKAPSTRAVGATLSPFAIPAAALMGGGAPGGGALGVAGGTIGGSGGGVSPTGGRAGPQQFRVAALVQGPATQEMRPASAV
jgi:hypothetical protein